MFPMTLAMRGALLPGEFFLEDRVDPAGVCLTAGLFHDRADEKTDEFVFAGLPLDKVTDARTT